MKTGIKTAGILTALLAGTIVAGAQQQGRGQRKQVEGQNTPESQQQECPTCGNPRFRSQQHRQDQRKPHIKRGVQKSQQQQQKQIKQRKRKAILELFDTNRDGQLSETERQAVRNAMQGRRNGTPKRHKAPSSEE